MARALFVLLILCFVASPGAAEEEEPTGWTLVPTTIPAKLLNSKLFQRWWWAYQQRAFPLGEIPADAQLRALEQSQAHEAATGVPTTQPVPGSTWTNIGPAPINGGQIGQTGNTRAMSGRVADIAVDPTNANHWLIGAAQGGVWETTDAGATWTPMTDAQASLAMGAIAFAPSNSSIIYAGTGEAAFAASAYAGAGLLKSTDGGATWSLLATSTFSKTSVSDLKVDPTNSNIVLAATTIGIAGRISGFPPSPPASGIYKSTDGGVTWSLQRSGEATDLEVDPSNFNNQFAGIGNPFGSATNGVYRSTNGGTTWTLISGPWSTMIAGVGRVELAMSPSTPGTLYVSIQDSIDSIGDDGGLLGLWRTDNAFATTPTWTQIPTGATDNGTGVLGYCGWDAAFSSASPQCFYDHEIIVDPANPATLYAGGVPLWKCTSCDATPIWTEVSKTASSPADGIHVDQHTMAWAGTRLIVGNDGGVWSTTDAGTTWNDHNTATLAITQFYDGSISPTSSTFALGGSQDNGTEKWTGSNAWTWILAGDGAASAISSAAPTTNWAASSQNLSIRRTTNGGTSFTTATSGIDPAGAPFIARFEMCPNNSDIFIAGTDNIWRSTNFFSGATPTWSNNLSGDFITGISGLAFTPGDMSCNTYAFGSAGGSLRITANGGTTWTDLDLPTTSPGQVPNRGVTDLAFHPTNSNILYVTLSGFDAGTPGQSGHLFKTSNALAASPTWSNVSPPVDIPFNSVALDSFDPNIVYVGTDMGVWKSTDAGTTWTQMGPSTGMPNVAVFDLKINHTTSTLIAFTHGRGAFALTLPPVTDLSCPTTVTAGATGTCTVTIGPTQSAATTVPLSSSTTAVLTTPSSVPVPATQTSATFTITGVAAGGPATVTAGPVSGTTATRTASVTVSSPPAGGGGGGGCFIATAAFGSPLAAEVAVLRKFRDKELLTHAPGRLVVAVYYRLSPPLARLIASNDMLRSATRVTLRPVIWWAGLALESPVLAWSLLILGVGGLVVVVITPLMLFRARRPGIKQPLNPGREV